MRYLTGLALARRRSRCKARGVFVGLALLTCAGPAGAAPGSGAATIAPYPSVVAGSSGTWAIIYTAAENFDVLQGGKITIDLPPGWSAPQISDSTLAGYVRPESAAFVDSVAVSGQTIFVHVGGLLTPQFLTGDSIRIVYGFGGGTASAAAQTTAPATATFLVSSDPTDTLAVSPIASSPSLGVVPDLVTHVRVVDPAMTPVGSFSRSADEDTTNVSLLGYDQFDNPARLVTGSWSVLGGIGTASPATGTGTVLTLTAAATGHAVGDSGAWADSTGLITVTHGTYVGLVMNADVLATAGGTFGANLTATDADGNGITSGPGSAAPIEFSATADSLGAIPADPDFVSTGATLSGGTWGGTLTARRAGTFWLAARDTAASIWSSPRVRIDVLPAAPDRIVAQVDTLHLTAGIVDTVTVLVLDAYGNRTPVLAGELMTLWKDRPGGRFLDAFGVVINEAILPVGADSVGLRYTDTQAGGGVGHVRVIDANGTGASLGTAEAATVVTANVPFGSFVLGAAPDTLMADGADSSNVTAFLIQDAFGNAVDAGHRFTVTASRVTPTNDDDPGTPGAQWTTTPSGSLSGWVRSGTTLGADTVSVQLGGASGQVTVVLVSGVPAGPIALVALPDSLEADSVSTRAVSAAGLEDANGNQVLDGEPFTVSTTLGSIASPDQDAGTPGIQRVASGGSISFLLFGGDQVGTATVSAASVRGSATGSVDVRLVPGSVSASRSTVAATSPVAVGAVGSTITVTLRDGQDHPLPNTPSDSISILVSGVAASVTPLGAVTDGAGTIDFRATATVAAPGTVSTTARGVALSDTPTIVFAPGPLDHFTLAGPGGTLTAGTADALQIAAKDAFDNPMPALSGVVLRPLVLAGGATVPDSLFLAGGIASVPFTPISATALTIEVRDDASHSVTYGPVAVGAGGPYRLIAVASPADTLAAGDSVAVQARLFDAHGNAVAGGTVGASIVAGSGSVAPAADGTDASGLADFMLHAGPAPGALALRLIAGASAAHDSIRADSIFVTVVPAVTASLQILPDSLNWIAGVPVRVRVRPLDRFGNIAPADTATVVMRPSGALQWAPAFGPLASGEFVTFATDTIAQSVTLAADRVGGGTGSAGLAIVIPAAPAAIDMVSGDGQTAVVDHDLAGPLRARARDAYGNVTPGAPVVFTVAVGNGSLDAVQGGAPDSIAVSDASGIASCEVVRLGTVAAPASDSFLARLLAAPAAQVLFTATAGPDVAASLVVAPPALSLAAGATANVVATALDVHGNLAPGTLVTFYLGAPALGTLESLGSTSGGSGSQTGFTSGSGTLAVRYRAPSSAPAADSIYARGVTIAPVGIRATVGASATAALQVVPDSLGWVAGDPVRVRVRAIDSFGNPVPADTATVVMRPSGATTWSPQFGPMTAGEFVTFARDTLAEALSSLAADRVGGGTGSAGPVTVRPAPPSGAIAIAAARDTLTADGRSSVTVTLGPVRDAFGNLVPAGTLVLASASAATLLAPDASPLPGLDLATAADGRASLVLIAPPALGADTLRASSRVGSASGLRAFVYEAPPSLAYAAGSIAPTVVVPGSAYAFQAAVRNTGSGTVQIGTGTSLTFGVGAAAYTTGLASALALGPGQTDTLRFAGAPVSPSLNPGTYAPALRTIGVDGTGEPFDFYLSLAGAQTHVAGISVAAVSAAPTPVPLGHTDLVLVFDVTNSTALAGTVDGASLAYSIGAFVTNSMTPPIPVSLAAGGTARFSISVRVPATGIPAGTVVDARFTATATFAGSSVAALNGAPLSFQVVSAAQIAAVPGGSTPPRYLRSRTYGPTARVANNGSAAVTLSRTATRLVLEHPGGDLVSTGLAAATAIAGGDSATLGFDSLAVPGTVARGRYGARLVLSGTEAGLAFADTIPLDPDSVSVLEPPILSVLGPISPDTVSAGQNRPVRVVLSNGGDVAFDFDPATALRLGAPLSTDLTLGIALSLGPAASVNMDFSGATLGSPFGPGTAIVTLEARGTEDGLVRTETFVAGALVGRPPSALAFVAGSTLPDTVRAGQSYDLTVTVQNGGGSTFTIDPASSRLLLSDGVEQASGPGVGAPIALGPGGQAALSFPGIAFPAALASQPYPVTLVLSGSEWGLADSAAVVSPASEIFVVEPAAGVQVRSLDVGAPVQVAAGATVRTWALEVTPIVPAGGVTSAHLTSVRLSVLADGSGAGAPSAVLASVSLRGSSGTLLAQSVAGPGNPLALTLSPPLALTSRAESLYVEVSISTAPASREVALRLASAPDLVVLDDLTGLLVPVFAGGGLAFAPLDSPTLTLFEKAHGYPNPFRAGREAVLLSYLLPQDAAVRVTIYTLLGDLVREIALPPGGTGGAQGLNEVAWDGRNGKGELVRPGLYVARIDGAGASEQIKVGVLR